MIFPADNNIGVESNLKLALKVAYRYVKNGQPIKDSDEFSDACVGLIQANENYNPDLGVKFSTYAYRCMNNAIINGIRKRNRINQHFSVIEEVGDLESKVIKEDNADVVAKLISGLEGRNKDVVISHYLEGETFASIGRRLGVTRAAISQTCSKALSKIRKSAIDDSQIV
jgi:RNA polymerase sigma factor (sigma-70 family)